MFYGLRLASRLRYGDVICIPDSTYALSLVQQPVDVRHRYASIIASVQELLRNTWNVVLKHSLREGNVCADFLTRMGSNSGFAYLELDCDSNSSLATTRPIRNCLKPTILLGDSHGAPSILLQQNC